MPRIAFGGIQHETNTFAPSPATYADFEQPDGWPGLTTGAEVAPDSTATSIFVPHLSRNADLQPCASLAWPEIE